MPIVARLCAAAFLADMALYLMMTAVPYQALALGAGPWILGLIPAARALPYSLSTVWAGGRTDRGPRLGPAGVSLLVAAVAVAILAAVSALPPIFALLAVVGVALAFFWPAVQATMADVAVQAGMAGNLGWFNVGWSSGKGAGFLVGGILLATLGFTAVYLLAAGLLLAVAVLVFGARAHGLPVPSDRHPADHAPATESHSAPDPRLRRFRLAAWLGNATAFGIGSVLNTHYPNWLEQLGRGEALFGSYLGLIFFSQTAMFVLLTRYQGWHYKIGWLVGAQVPMVLVLWILPRLAAPWEILATAPLVGIGLGTAYFASIFYSVSAAESRGRNAGVHEGVLGIGAMALPILGGWAARATGSLQAPYVFSWVAAIGIMAVQLALLAGTRRAR